MSRKNEGAGPSEGPPSDEGARPKLAVVVSHPIQYYAPYYRAIAQEGSVDIKVFYCSRIGVDPMMDPRMGVEITWKADLLGGYAYEFLPEAPQIKTYKFWDVNNPSISEKLDEFSPDVVLLHGYAHATLVRSILWCRRKKIPIMNISDRSLFGLTTPIRKFARKLTLPAILRQFSAFLVLSDAVSEFYANFSAKAEQIFRIPSMLDEGFWTFRDNRETHRKRIREELGLGENVTFLFVGKFIALKRVQDIIDALKMLADRHGETCPVQAIFAGDGELRKTLEQEAKDAGLPVHFLGFVNMDELPAYYCAADVLVHPAENESFGLIAVEAAIFGLPMIMSDRVGAVGETSIARPEFNTIAYPCGNVGALADAMERLATDDDLRQNMSAASFELAEEHRGEVSVRNTIKAIDYCLEAAEK